jgi:hypothetical protein
MNPISFDAVRALADAAGSLKLATLSMATLRQVRPRGEEDAPEVTSYAGTLNSAIQSSQASQIALNRAQVEIDAQESLRQQQLQQEAEAQARALDRERRRKALEDARTEAQVEAQEDGGRNSGEDASGRSGESAAERPSSGTDAAPNPVEGEAPKGVIYTHQGAVKGSAPRKKLSVTV